MGQKSDGQGGRRWAFRMAGGVMVGLGVLGIFLPVLPTTPFLLAAAWLFSKGSPDALRWLIHHRVLGAYIRDYRAGHGIPLKIKIFALLLLWATILSSVFLVLDVLWLQAMLVVIALAVTLHLCRLPTRKLPPLPREEA